MAAPAYDQRCAAFSFTMQWPSSCLQRSKLSAFLYHTKHHQWFPIRTEATLVRTLVCYCQKEGINRSTAYPVSSDAYQGLEVLAAHGTCRMISVPDVLLSSAQQYQQQYFIRRMCLNLPETSSHAPSICFELARTRATRIRC